MSKIEIKDIGINGNDLFDDSESFLNDLSEDISSSVNGGGTTVIDLPPLPTNTSPASPFGPEPEPYPGFPTALPIA